MPYASRFVQLLGIYGADEFTVLVPVQGILAGGVGSLVDSLLGVLIQSPQRLVGRPRLWKSLNCLVNFLSASFVSALAPLVDANAKTLLPVLALVMLLVCAATAPGVTATTARKILHIGTSVLIIYTDLGERAHEPDSAIRPLLLVLSTCAALAGALSWQRRWITSPLLRFELNAAKPAPGIGLYAAAVCTSGTRFSTACFVALTYFAVALLHDSSSA